MLSRRKQGFLEIGVAFVFGWGHGPDGRARARGDRNGNQLVLGGQVGLPWHGEGVRGRLRPRVWPHELRVLMMLVGLLVGSDGEDPLALVGVATLVPAATAVVVVGGVVRGVVLLLLLLLLLVVVFCWDRLLLLLHVTHMWLHEGVVFW